MKLLCETVVRYRLSPGTSTARALKSTVALGRHPPNKQDAELFLILFTATNKTGTRYKITSNIERIFTKFLHEGKATISLRQPEHDLQIRCDFVQLKCFLHALRLGLEGKSLQNREIQTLAATAIPPSAHPITKMTILSRGDYPLRGLPRTLKALTVGYTLFFFAFLFNLFFFVDKRNSEDSCGFTNIFPQKLDVAQS